jgi:hypothetical protein
MSLGVFGFTARLHLWPLPILFLVNNLCRSLIHFFCEHHLFHPNDFKGMFVLTIRALRVLPKVANPSSANWLR